MSQNRTRQRGGRWVFTQPISPLCFFKLLKKFERGGRGRFSSFFSNKKTPPRSTAGRGKLVKELIAFFYSISICNFIFFEYTYIVITNRLYGLSNCYLVGAIFFLYSNFHLRFVRESIFSLAVFLRKMEYFFSFGTIKVNNLFFS